MIKVLTVNEFHFKSIIENRLFQYGCLVFSRRIFKLMFRDSDVPAMRAGSFRFNFIMFYPFINCFIGYIETLCNLLHCVILIRLRHIS